MQRQRDRSEPVLCPTLEQGVLALCLVGMTSLAHAQADFVDGRGLDPRLVRPASDDFGFIGVEGAGGFERGEYGALVSLSDALSVVRVGHRSGESAPDDRPLIDDAITATLALQVGLLERGPSALSLGLTLPLHVIEGDVHVIEGSYNAAVEELRSQGLGAPSVLLKWAPWSTRRTPLGAALLASADPGVAGALRSDPGVTLWPRVVLEWLPAPATLSLNAGYRVVTGRGPWLADEIRYDDQITLSASARVRVYGALELGAELHASQIAQALGEQRALSSELDLGARLALGSAHVTLAGGFGLGSGVLEPDGRVMLVISLRSPPRDEDHDGLAGDADACPAQAEDFDLHVDGDGCPEQDNDGDGVLDARDACPDDFGSASAQGCPMAGEGGRAE